MDLKQLEAVKRLTIISVFADDVFLEKLALKGGNALDLVYGISPRASLDFDFSMSEDFDVAEIPEIESRIRKSLENTFREAGYRAFDIKFSQKPEAARADVPTFWGGYYIEFKVVPIELYKALGGDIEKVRRQAIPTGPSHAKPRKFKIQISKHEFFDPRVRRILDGYTVYAYAPLMIALEKIRTICQQMPDYAQIIGKSHVNPRARDFFDIYAISDRLKFDISTAPVADILAHMFSAKQVPLSLIRRIREHRDFHARDFDSLRDTVKPGVELRDFDFYFSYVIDLCAHIKLPREE